MGRRKAEKSRQIKNARLVGVYVMGTAALGSLALLFAISLRNPSPALEAKTAVLWNDWTVMYDTGLPPASVFVGSLFLALVMAAGVAWIEKRITNRYRRSDNKTYIPLSPKVVMAATRGEYAGPVTITVLIPAHNEQDCIEATIKSLQVQSVPPERIIVVADNCSDRTVELSRAMGADIFESVGNTHKKAGALNQVLKAILPAMGDNDTVMVMDADTTLDAGFLEFANKRLTDDRALMAAGGLFYGDEGGGLLGQFQRNEYIRYQRELKRRRGLVFVLTGTATVFRSRALRTVAQSRGGLLPGLHGDVYDTVALTEDNELTMALKTLGALITSPSQCTVVTEVMPGLKALWAQRLRWQRGALENIGAYGLRPTITKYWAQQLGIAYGVIALSTYLTLLFLMVVSIDQWIWFPFWLSIGSVFSVERLVTVWKGGWKARLLALLLLPELLYAMFLNAVFVKGILDITFDRKASWKHVTGGVVK